MVPTPATPAPQAPKEYLNLAETAALLGGVTNRTVLNWCKLGRLYPRRMSRKTILFRRVDVLAAIEKYRFGDPNPPRDASLG